MKSSMTRRAAHFLGAAAVGLTWTAIGQTAHAQDAGDSAGGVEEVYVVAQRRVENLQDVPVSASAITADTLSDLLSGGGDVLQLAGRAPGLNIESSNGRAAPRFYLRGLGNTDFDLAASQPVSVLMDDVVMENVALKSFPIFDIAQVEVLRGPQGTLFGRNTPAGIVHFRSVRPSQDFSADYSASYATYESSSVEAAMGGGLAEGLSARGSFMYRRRVDWVNNDFNGGDLGGYKDMAGRFQILAQPNDQFSALFNVHARSLEGTSTLFRANIFDTGSNELNANYSRKHVSYNQGGGNHQGYDNVGVSATLTYDFGSAELTSITAYETANGDSRGDIDGGVAGVGPGFIPFDSDTKDSLDDLDQFTHEIRLASNTDDALNWQVGAFYFDSDFVITTVGPFGFPPSTTLNHTNTSWAVFGQVGYDVSDALKVSAGLRYTDDEKHLKPITTAFPVDPVSVSDNQVSWDLSATYTMAPDVNLYGRIASGFRAPTIQGRDIAFFSPPSVAQSETILSEEVGVKSQFWGNRARVNGDIFHYTINDQQFSAIGGAGNLTQLVNADKGEAYGLELEGEFALTNNLFWTVSYAYTHTEIQDANLTVAPCGSGQCTPTDPVDGLGNRLIDGNPFPQAPEYTFDTSLSYEIPLSSGAAFFATTDWTVRGPLNFFLYDAAEFKTDSQFEGGLKIGYRTAGGHYEAAVFARNITDEDNAIGAIDFNNNTGFVNEPRIVGISVNAKLN